MAYGPWLMSMPHWQGLSNNTYPESNHSNSWYWHLFLRLILIFSCQLRLGTPRGFFPAGLPVKILKTLLPSSNLATCPTHLNLLDLITMTVLVRYSSSLRTHLHSPFSCILGPYISFRIVFSNNLTLNSSPNVRDLFFFYNHIAYLEILLSYIF